LEKAIEYSKATPKLMSLALSRLSMVLRKIGHSREEFVQNTKDALGKAKEAVGLDLNSSHAWYVLGNAHLTHFFVKNNNYDLKDLNSVLAAFKQAEKQIFGLEKMDLYLNRATVYRYLEQYQLAMDDLSKALQIDPQWNSPLEAMDSIFVMLKKIKHAIDTKGQLKVKKIRQYENQLNIIKESSSIDQLQIQENNGKTLVGIIISLITNPTSIPLMSVIMDKKGDCIALSIYNLTEAAINVGNQISISDPKLKEIKLIHNDEVIQFRSVVVETPNTLKINDHPIKNEHRAVTGYSITNH